MKHLQVSCAIIENDGAVLATQRSAIMSLPLKWEFPGGKIAEGELPIDCLRREILEELGLNIRAGQSSASYAHHYPDFAVTLYPFMCLVESGELILHEHAAFAWRPSDKLCTLDWAEADLPIVQTRLSKLKVAAP